MLRFCRKAVEAGMVLGNNYGTVGLWSMISGGK